MTAGTGTSRPAIHRTPSITRRYAIGITRRAAASRRVGTHRRSPSTGTSSIRSRHRDPEALIPPFLANPPPGLLARHRALERSRKLKELRSTSATEHSRRGPTHRQNRTQSTACDDATDDDGLRHRAGRGRRMDRPPLRSWRPPVAALNGRRAVGAHHRRKTTNVNTPRL